MGENRLEEIQEEIQACNFAIGVLREKRARLENDLVQRIRVLDLLSQIPDWKEKQKE